MRKVQLLVAAPDTAGLDDLAAALEAEAGRAHAMVRRHHGRVRWGVKVPEDPFSATEQGREAASFVIDGFVEVAVRTTTDWPELLEPVTGAADRLGAQVDPSRSAVVVGVEHDIVPGDLPVLLVYALRRLPALTGEEFRDHWLYRHAEFGRRLQAGRGYRQLHADGTQSALASASTGLAVADLDGVAEASFPDVDVFLESMSRPEVAADAMEDEKRFIDHSRSAGALTRVQLVESG